MLPISEYPEIVPPTVVVSGQYPGASPKTIAETVITPLEQQINGVENAIYTNSTATPDGAFSITVTFRLGTDLDIAQVQTQNRVAQAEPRLPDVVRQIGLVTQKRSPDLTMVVFLRSVDGRYDSLYLRNYAVIQIRDVLARLHGMGDVEVFGSGDYAMRLWLDPGKLAARSMDVDEVLAAVREQNVQVAAGQIGGQPALPGTRVPIHRQRSRPAADRARVRQHRRQERRRTARPPICAMSRGSNWVRTPTRCAACSTAARRSRFRCSSCRAPTRWSFRPRCATTMKELAKNFPQGVTYEIDYDPTVFVRSSIEAVVHTLFEAVLLVVLVVVVFLQTWRASVIPLVAVPVAIIGTMAALLLAGFSINSLTLFGLVLATGIVVDDAIVVVENIERKIEDGLNPHAAAHAAMGEVTRPIISIMLVLCAVFIPVAFVSGLTGQFYRQFGITIAASTIISTFNSLTLSPALAALLLKPRNCAARCVPARHQSECCGRFFALFNRVFEQRLGALRPRRVAYYRPAWRSCSWHSPCLLVGTWGLFRLVPGGFIPAQDKQYLVGIVQLPDAASLDRTEQVVRQNLGAGEGDPRRRSRHRLFGPLGAGIRQSEQRGGVFFPLKSFDERKTKDSLGGGNRRRAQQEIRLRSRTR